MRQHPLIGFFVLAYGFSWLMDIGLILPLGIPAALGIFLSTLGPTCAAVIVICVEDGRPGLGHLLRRVTLWRTGAQWYLIALLGIPFVYLLGTLVLPGAIAGFRAISPLRWLVEYAIILTAGGIVGGPFFEEPGWRGFALPRLQAQLGPLVGTLVPGGLWAVWHYPQFLVPEWASQNGGLQPSTVAVFTLTVISIAVILTWLFNHTGGSLLLAMLAHSSVNTSQVVLVDELFPNAVSTEVNALLGFGSMALVLILVTRGRLGYRGAYVASPERDSEQHPRQREE